MHSVFQILSFYQIELMKWITEKVSILIFEKMLFLCCSKSISNILTNEDTVLHALILVL